MVILAYIVREFRQNANKKTECKLVDRWFWSPIYTHTKSLGSQAFSLALFLQTEVIILSVPWNEGRGFLRLFRLLERRRGYRCFCAARTGRGAGKPGHPAVLHYRLLNSPYIRWSQLHWPKLPLIELVAKPVAIKVIWCLWSRVVSRTTPKMILASGSTACLMTSAAGWLRIVTNCRRRWYWIKHLSRRRRIHQ